MRDLPEQRLYWVWAAMIQRCENASSKDYAAYGAKGISVCARWRSSFASFRSDLGLPLAGMTLERMDNAKGYNPDNCRWATRQEQNANRPNWCHYYTVNGVRLTMKDTWRVYAHQSLTYRCFVKRLITRGWTIDKALNTPVRVHHAA